MGRTAVLLSLRLYPAAWRMQVVEMEGWSSRALVNWGRALCIRADLMLTAEQEQQQQQGGYSGGGASPTMSVVAQLYTSAINKFEAVLEGEPGMMPAKYRCATRTTAPRYISNKRLLGGVACLRARIRARARVRARARSCVEARARPLASRCSR